MRNLFALVGAGTIAFVGLGWYLGWYSLTRQPGTTGGTQRFQVDVHPTKITDDVHKGISRVGEITDRLSDDKAAPKDQTNATEPIAPSGKIAMPTRDPVNPTSADSQSIFRNLQNVNNVGPVITKFGGSGSTSPLPNPAD